MCSLPAAGAVQRRMAAWPASPGWPPVALRNVQPIVGFGQRRSALPSVFREVGQGLELDGAGAVRRRCPSRIAR